MSIFPPLTLLGNLNSKSPPVMQSEYTVQERAAYFKKKQKRNKPASLRIGSECYCSECILPTYCLMH